MKTTGMDYNALIRIAILLTQVSGKHKYIIFDSEYDLDLWTAYPFNSKSAAAKKFQELISTLNKPTQNTYRRVLNLDPTDDLMSLDIDNVTHLSFPVRASKLDGHNIIDIEGSEGIATVASSDVIIAWPEGSNSQHMNDIHRIYPTTKATEGIAVEGIKPIKAP
jgi:hypothetical protein